jgi:fatty acid desaturase
VSWPLVDVRVGNNNEIGHGRASCSSQNTWMAPASSAVVTPGQLLKDYLAFPLLSGIAALTTLLGKLIANLTRNVWSHAVIFCGHFPDGTLSFTEDQVDDETRGHFYVRQLLGSATRTTR